MACCIFGTKPLSAVRETNARQCECILSLASRKLARASGILDRTYKGHRVLGECSRNLVSHTDLNQC